MDHQDRDLILGLAHRLRQAPPVAQDPQAAELIAQQISSQPNSVYLLVQAVLLQDEALRQAQARIAAMGAQNPGYGQNPAFANSAFTQRPGYGSDGYARDGYGRDDYGRDGYGHQNRAGGGFMKTAAAAAAGVAGGALLVAGANELFSSDQPTQTQGGGQQEDEGVSFTDLF